VLVMVYVGIVEAATSAMEPRRPTVLRIAPIDKRMTWELRSE